MIVFGRSAIATFEDRSLETTETASKLCAVALSSPFPVAEIDRNARFWVLREKQC